MRKKTRSPCSDRTDRGAGGSRRADHARRLVAQQAARIILEQGISDYGVAKRKAAARLGLSDRSSLPRNTEIEEALLERQRLFAGDEHASLLRRLRQTAARSMRLLSGFEPRLVGSVLSGSAAAHSDVNLHLFVDTAERVAWHLMSSGIPYRESQRRLRFDKDRQETFPVYRFSADGVDIDATVFPTVGLRQAPLNPVDGRPLKRARLSEVQAMLEERPSVMD